MRIRLILPNPTIPAKQLWAAIYDEPWPKGWRVKWITGFPRDLSNYLSGDCNHRTKRIRLSFHSGMIDAYIDDLVRKRWRVFFGERPPDWRFGGPIETLIHEFVHVRRPRLKHGAAFNRLVNNARKRLTSHQTGQTLRDAA